MNGGLSLRNQAYRIGETSEADDRSNTGILAGLQNRIVRGGELESIQDVVEPGATALEVRVIHRMKQLANQVELFCQSTHVRRAWSVIFAFLLAWIVGRTAVSVIPGLQNEVGVFLRSVHLGQYTGRFAEKGYATLQDMLLATDDDLRDYVGVVTVPHRRRILRYAQLIREQRSILPALFWVSIITMVVATIVVGLAMLVSAQIRDRVICVTMFWGFMSWYRVRLWQRLWSTLDVVRSPRVTPKVCEPPIVVEPRRTFTSTSGTMNPNRQDSGVLTNMNALPESDPVARNSNNRLSGRWKRRRNRS